MIQDFFSLKCGCQLDHTRRNVAAATYAKHIMILKTDLNPAAELPFTRCCLRATWTWLMYLQNRFPGIHQLLVHIYIVSYCEQNSIEWERGVHLCHRKSIHEFMASSPCEPDLIFWYKVFAYLPVKKNLSVHCWTAPVMLPNSFWAEIFCLAKECCCHILLFLPPWVFQRAALH